MDELLKKVDSKYTLIGLVAKRAQEVLSDGEKSMKASEIIEKIFQEIIQDKITVKKEEPGESEQKESGEDKESVRRLPRGEKD